VTFIHGIPRNLSLDITVLDKNVMNLTYCSRHADIWPSDISVCILENGRFKDN
jgi:hypothetical protein